MRGSDYKGLYLPWPVPFGFADATLRTGLQRRGQKDTGSPIKPGMTARERVSRGFVPARRGSFNGIDIT